MEVKKRDLGNKAIGFANFARPPSAHIRSIGSRSKICATLPATFVVLVQDDDDAEIKAAKRWCVLRAEAGQLLLPVFASEEQHALMNVEYSVSLRKCREEDRGRAIVQYRKSDPIFYLEIPRFEVLVDKEELQLFGNGSQRFICNAPSEKAAKNWVRELGAAGCEVSPQSSATATQLQLGLVWLSCGSLCATRD